MVMAAHPGMGHFGMSQAGVPGVPKQILPHTPSSQDPRVPTVQRGI